MKHHTKYVFSICSAPWQVTFATPGIGMGLGGTNRGQYLYDDHHHLYYYIIHYVIYIHFYSFLYTYIQIYMYNLYILFIYYLYQNLNCTRHNPGCNWRRVVTPPTPWKLFLWRLQTRNCHIYINIFQIYLF